MLAAQDADAMTRTRQYMLLSAVIITLVLPAAGAFWLYYYTKNPYWRPLGITREKLAAVSREAKYVAISVVVDWGRDRMGGLSQDQLRAQISATLNMRTDDYFFRFREVPGNDIGVSFSVGPNLYGPYPPDRMIEGISPALEALEMTRNALE